MTVTIHTQSQLKDAEQPLAPDPSHTELLSRNQALEKEKIGAVREKPDALKQEAGQQMESVDSAGISMYKGRSQRQRRN